MRNRRSLERRINLAERRRAARPSTPDRQRMKSWFSLVTGAAAVTGIAIGVFGWTLNFVRPTSIKVDPPAVIEFRCSASTIINNNCGDDFGTSAEFAFPAGATDDRGPPALTPGKVLPSLSITGAFRIQALGSTSNAATLEPASAVIIFPKVANFSETKLTLTAYWSGSLIPGKNVTLTQVVPRAMHHGDVFHQEIWFMPITGSCLESGVLGCTAERDDSFMDWWLFRREIMNRIKAVYTDEAELSESSISITFSFNYQTSNGLYRLLGLEPYIEPAEPVVCDIELTRSHFDLAANPKFVAHPVKCQ